MLLIEHERRKIARGIKQFRIMNVGEPAQIRFSFARPFRKIVFFHVELSQPKHSSSTRIFPNTQQRFGKPENQRVTLTTEEYSSFYRSTSKSHHDVCVLHGEKQRGRKKNNTCFIDFECDNQNYTNLYEMRNVYGRWPYVVDSPLEFCVVAARMNATLTLNETRLFASVSG